VVLGERLDNLPECQALFLCAADQLQAPGTAALLGQVPDIRERRVQVMLAEVVRAEGAAKEAKLAVEVVVGLVLSASRCPWSAAAGRSVGAS
jgi:hypothetical protein